MFRGLVPSLIGAARVIHLVRRVAVPGTGLAAIAAPSVEVIVPIADASTDINVHRAGLLIIADLLVTIEGIVYLIVNTAAPIVVGRTAGMPPSIKGSHTANIVALIVGITPGIPKNILLFLLGVTVVAIVIRVTFVAYLITNFQAKVRSLGQVALGFRV